MPLSVSRLVKVTVNLTPLAAQTRSFGVLAIAGDSNVISGLERIRTYLDVEGVATDFGVTSPEFLAAELYFSQSPQPSTLMIGRWLRTATAGFNEGGILSPSQQVISNFNGISNGGFVIIVDGVVKTLTGLDFTSQTNLNGVASVINGSLTGATVTWDGQEFKVTSNTVGAGVKASGTVTMTGSPANNDTLTIGGTLITFKTASPVGSQVLIGPTAAQTMVNLLAFLQASTDTNLILATYAAMGTVLTVSYGVVGVAGNSYTLAKSSTNITLSGATLAGGAPQSSVGYATVGTGTDISGLLKLNAANAQALIGGYDPETPIQCASALVDKSTVWYGLMFAASVMPTDQQNLDVSAFIEALDLKRIYGVSIQNTNVLSSLVTNDLASLMAAGGYEQSFCQYSSSSPYSVASFFGRAFSVDFNANNSTITLMFKQEPGIVPEELTENQAAVLTTKRCNVFVEYDNNTAIIQNGVMSGPAFFDEVHGLNWMQNQIQTACYNVLYTSPTKIPQTDAGVNTLVNAISGACSAGVNNGLVAPGVWNAPGFGTLQQGQFLKTGYYVFAPSVALQSQADREARKSPPIQVALKLAGAIQSLDVLVDVNR